jgi:phospholipase/carboxylesterase
MSSSESKQNEKAQKIAVKRARNGLHSAGGTFPPEPPPRPWYGDPNWVKVAVSIAALLVAGAALYHHLSQPPSSAEEVVGLVGQTESGSDRSSAGQVSVDDARATADVVPLHKPLPKHGLEYEELVTGGGDPDSPLPLIIAAHGLGDRPDRFKKLFLRLPFAARVIVPRAPGDYHEGYTWFATEIEDGHVKRLDYATMADSAQRLAWLAEALVIQWPTAGKPVITGFSQGGILSFVVAASHPDLVAAAIPMSGLWPVEMRPSGPFEAAGSMPVVVALHGEEDGLVPFDSAHESVEAMKALGMDARMEPYPDVAHRISGEMRLRLYELLQELLAGSEVAYLTSAM